MYTTYFKLRARPFAPAPDPAFLFMSAQHQEALAHLRYGFGSENGFIMLTGPAGSGKTTICRALLAQPQADAVVAPVSGAGKQALELLNAAGRGFGLRPRPGNNSIKAATDRINDFLLAAHAQGRNPVLVIDQAHELGADALEQIRLLTNLETNERKLLQIILLGRPALETTLARHDLRQVNQRITARCRLSPLNREQTARYIRHRLRVAGGRDDLFSPAACAVAHVMGRGVPRRINRLCHHALLTAFARGRASVDRKAVLQAAAGARPAARPLMRLAALHFLPL